MFTRRRSTCGRMLRTLTTTAKNFLDTDPRSFKIKEEKDAKDYLLNLPLKVLYEELSAHGELGILRDRHNPFRKSTTGIKYRDDIIFQAPNRVPVVVAEAKKQSNESRSTAGSFLNRAFTQIKSGTNPSLQRSKFLGIGVTFFETRVDEGTQFVMPPKQFLLECQLFTLTYPEAIKHEKVADRYNFLEKGKRHRFVQDVQGVLLKSA